MGATGAVGAVSDWQEWVALTIVGCVAAGVALHCARLWLAAPLAQWLLKRGRVKWAMRMHRWAK